LQSLPGYSQIGTEEFPVLEIIDHYGPLYGQCKYVSILPSKKIPFVLLLLLPSFARTVQVQVATQFFMIFRHSTATCVECVLTTVLTLYFKLLPDSSYLLPEDSQLGDERRKQCRGMWCDFRRPLWHCISRNSSCSQVCTIHATSSFFPAASTHTVITATKLQRSRFSCSTRHCWLMQRCFASKKPCLACGMERCLWTARTPVLSHSPPHRTGRSIRIGRHIQDATAPVRSPACDMFIKTQATPFWSAWR
jgi:hypothetical protein